MMLRDFDEGQVAPLGNQKNSLVMMERNASDGKSSLKLIAPFETCSDALEMIITLQHHTLKFHCDRLPKALEGVTRNQGFNKVC